MPTDPLQNRVGDRKVAGGFDALPPIDRSAGYLDSDSESLAAALGAALIDHVCPKYRTIHASKFMTRLGTAWVDSQNHPSA